MIKYFNDNDMNYDDYTTDWREHLLTGKPITPGWIPFTPIGSNSGTKCVNCPRIFHCLSDRCYRY